MVTAAAAGPPASFSLACHACGRCCNSAPALSMRELFRHRERFAACLAIGRVARRRPGERVRTGGHEQVLDANDADSCNALADTLFVRTAPGRDWLALTAQGIDYPSLDRCPALAGDGRCSLHEAGKPAICEAVPLDPLAPDRLQPLVLAARRDTAVWFGAGCLHDAPVAGAMPLVEAGRVAAPAALDAYREALRVERAIWRDAVAARLLASGAGWARSWAQLAPGARLTIPVVPALLEIARVSARCRDACIEVADCQQRLIATMIETALARRRADDREATRELRGFAEALVRLRRELGSAAFTASAHAAVDANAVEAWLGVA
ncbi:hypothetical protein [Burkholderia plantarii]|uniref:Flagellin N-methylase n=1 Tax=Burkholderia plantarii TaxID=41899 RepID=A0A0B6S1I0_BURPL|nr:hypothetical protein [Burkholderia plantarii]AJK49513.1 hypothetical protein BGL_2c14460 [Burkholderia plantarii]